jgi:serine/threonine-protein kinase
MRDVPPEPGAVLLQYRLTEKIGEGGMGVVWRAIDTTLGREVAIKFLPPGIAADADRLARFDREARLLASLSHPNIAGVFGLHQVGGQPFLVMEYVSGEDLASRLARGPLPVDEALRVARDVASGLEAAHESGVIHRDLKPANVKLTPDGRAKVLDFGLAKAAEGPSVASDDASRSPTLTSAGTLAGVILGTASYMSPEQAAGRPIDRRCDIWSFGVVLHELLTGRRMFEGETISHTLADVLRAPIDVSGLPAAVPRSVQDVVRRCLERDPKRRLRDIGEARITLENAIDRPESTVELRAIPQRSASSRWPWLVAAVGLVIAAVSVGWSALLDRAKPEPTYHFMLTMPNVGSQRQGDGTAIAISPDGKRIVTRGGAGTDDILYVRALDEFEPKPIPGTAGANAPEFSPDGHWIAFATTSGLQKVRPEGGTVTRVAALSRSGTRLGYHWAADGFFYYASEGALWRVPETGGQAERLTPDDPGSKADYEEPFAVPQAGIVLCNTRGGTKTKETRELFALHLGSHELKDLGTPGGDPRYLPTGHLLFSEGERIFVAPFDVRALEFRGAPVPVLERAGTDIASMQVAVSQNGTVAYLPARPGETPSLVYVDHTGKMEPIVPAGLSATGLNDPRISPDAKRLAVSTGTQAIWMIDLETQTPTLLTESGFYPLWSPDGSQILYASARGKTFDVYRVPVDLSRPETLVLDRPNNMRTMDWTRQGVVVLREEVPEKGMDLFTWSNLSDEGTIQTLLDGPDDELAPVVSVDGKWMAYVSNYSGSDEVYVTSFPVAGARVKVSSDGGHSPTWAPDGKTLYYMDRAKMTAARVEPGPAFRVLGREVLFEDDFAQYRWSRQYDITPDGKRFVMIKNPPRGNVEVITNWFAELEGKTR